MKKTPEEIKKGLKCCSDDNILCESCPYDFDGTLPCNNKLLKNALAYIKQLEKRNNRLEYTLMGVMHSVDKWLEVEPYDFDKDDGTEAVTRAANAREIMLKAIEHLERERDAAVDDLRSVIIDVDKGCILCAHYHECKGEACPHFESGVEAVHMYGSQIYDFEWTCELFEYGTCAEMENTPCNGCDLQNHWEWRGVKEENDG